MTPKEKGPVLSSDEPANIDDIKRGRSWIVTQTHLQCPYCFGVSKVRGEWLLDTKICEHCDTMFLV